MEKKYKTRSWLIRRSSLCIVLIFATLLTSKGDLTSGQHEGMRQYNVGVLMVSRLDSPFDLERAGPAVDMALELVNEQFLYKHNVSLRKVQARYDNKHCSLCLNKTQNSVLIHVIESICWNRILILQLVC